MIRKLLILTLLAITFNSYAQGPPTLLKAQKAQTNTTVSGPHTNYKHSYSHAMHFSLERQIAISGKIEGSGELATLINNAGGEVTTSFFQKFFVPKIQFKRKKHIHTTFDPDVLQITITPRKVLVLYNTDQAALKAMDILVSMIKESSVGWIISGCDITHWGDFGAAEVIPVQKGQIEMAPKMVTRHSIQGVIDKQPKGATIILSLISNSSWAIESDIMMQDCPGWQNLSAPFSYTQTQIKFLVDYARSKNVKIILRLDLNDKCKPFVKATGHVPSTAEGMRFARAVIEELARTTGCKEFLVPHNTNQFQYTALLMRVAELNNINIQY